MRCYTWLVLVVLGAVLSACRQENNLILKNQDRVVVYDNKKSSYENGMQYGKRYAKEIQASTKRWTEFMESHTGKSIKRLKTMVEQRSNLIAAINKYTPNVLLEINGIAIGAGVDPDVLLLFNIGEEIYHLTNYDFQSCSNVAAVVSEGVTMVYNQDLPQFLHNESGPVLLQKEDALLFAFPGSVGISGFNKNFAVSCNSLPGVKGNGDGLPLSFVLNKILEMSSIQEATNFIEKVHLPIPQNLMFVDGTQLFNLEVSEKGFTTILPQNGFCAHTNYSLTSNQWMDHPNTNKCNRMKFLLENISKTKALQTEKIHSLFTNDPINNEETYLSWHTTYNASGLIEARFYDDILYQSN
ncbi:MAG: C45 family autoproteolytic acyltransferase/hydrolase [Bacteroidota bacterium]